MNQVMVGLADHSVLVVQDQATTFIRDSGGQQIGRVFNDEAAVVLAGVPGPRGRDGAGAGEDLERISGQVISALVIVYELDGQVFILDRDDSEHIDLILGLTMTAAEPQRPIKVRMDGIVDDRSWNFIPGRVWLGRDGRLTQVPPDNGFDVLVGCALSATRLKLDITDSIELED